MDSSIRFVPLSVSRIQFAFLVHVRPILRCRVMIEETHHRTIGDKRYDAVGLVFGKLEGSDPDKNNDQTEAQKPHAHAIQTRHAGVDAFHDAGLSRAWRPQAGCWNFGVWAELAVCRGRLYEVWRFGCGVHVEASLRP